MRATITILTLLLSLSAFADCKVDITFKNEAKKKVHIAPMKSGWTGNPLGIGPYIRFENLEEFTVNPGKQKTKHLIMAMDCAAFAFRDIKIAYRKGNKAKVHTKIKRVFTSVDRKIKFKLD